MALSESDAFSAWVRSTRALDTRPGLTFEDEDELVESTADPGSGAAAEAPRVSAGELDVARSRLTLPTFLSADGGAPGGAPPAGSARARHAAALAELDGAEDDVMRLLTLAASCAEQLAAGRACDGRAVERSADEYAATAQRVHATLARLGRAHAIARPAAYTRASGVATARAAAARAEERATERLRELEEAEAARLRTAPAELAARAEQMFGRGEAIWDDAPELAELCSDLRPAES